MDSFDSMDSWGGFHMGANGVTPSDPTVHDTLIDQEAVLSLRDEIQDTGERRMFYTPAMQREVTLHRLRTDFEISRRRLIYANDKDYYNYLLGEVEAQCEGQWPPAGVHISPAPVEGYPVYIPPEPIETDHPINGVMVDSPLYEVTDSSSSNEVAVDIKPVNQVVEIIDSDDND